MRLYLFIFLFFTVLFSILIWYGVVSHFFQDDFIFSIKWLLIVILWLIINCVTFVFLIVTIEKWERKQKILKERFDLVKGTGRTKYNKFWKEYK